MSALEAVKAYYGLFGARGVVLAAKARWFDSQTEVTAMAAGLKHPVHLRLRTSDVGVFRQVLVAHEYDWEFAKSPRVIIDCGANIGLTSVFYANKYPRATIIAVEPEPSNFQMLQKNSAPYPSITAVRAALWKENSEITLVDPGLGHYGFCTIESPNSAADVNRHTLVPAVTVDRLMADHGLEFIDILKVDIEGSEKEMFENSTAWIDSVGVIAIELHDRLRVGCTRSVYSATQNFQIQWRRGETVFLARREYAGNTLRTRAAGGRKMASSSVNAKAIIRELQGT